MSLALSIPVCCLCRWRALSTASQLDSFHLELSLPVDVNESIHTAIKPLHIRSTRRLHYTCNGRPFYVRSLTYDHEQCLCLFIFILFTHRISETRHRWSVTLLCSFVALMLLYNAVLFGKLSPFFRGGGQKPHVSENCIRVSQMLA